MNQTYPLPGFAAAMMLATLTLLPVVGAGPIVENVVPIVEDPICSTATGEEIPPGIPNLASQAAAGACGDVVGVLAQIDAVTCEPDPIGDDGVDDCIPSEVSDIAEQACPDFDGTPPSALGCASSITDLIEDVAACFATTDTALPLPFLPTADTQCIQDLGGGPGGAPTAEVAGCEVPTNPPCLAAAAEDAATMLANEIATRSEIVTGTIFDNNPVVGPILEAQTPANAFAKVALTIRGTVEHGLLTGLVHDEIDSTFTGLEISVLVDDTTPANLDWEIDGDQFEVSFKINVAGTHTVDVIANFVDAPLNSTPFRGFDQLVLDFKDAAAGGFDLELTVSAVPTTIDVLNILDDSAVTPPTTRATALHVTLRDSNGVSEITPASISTKLETPGGEPFALVASGSTTRTVGARDPQASIVTYTYGVVFPSRVKDGLYTFETTFPGAQAQNTAVTVQNIAPTIKTKSTTIALSTGAGSTVSAMMTVEVDDLNFGRYSASVAAVRELDDLVIQVTGDRTVDVGDVEISVGSTVIPLVGGVGTVDLSNDESMAALQRLVTVEYQPSGQSEDGVFTITARIIDDGGFDAIAVLGTLTVVPLEAGFGLTVDDGNDGLQFANLAPGESATSEPLQVSVTKQQGLAFLRIELPDLQKGADRIDSDGIEVKLCPAGTDFAACTGVTGTVLNGVAQFTSFTGVTVTGGSAFDAYFTLTVPNGTPAGNYRVSANAIGSPTALS